MSLSAGHIPSLPGTYVLSLFLKRECRLTVGKLGAIFFKPGFYAYVGSALGPGGLRARLRRHLKAQKKYHWHIDYLRRRARIVGLWAAAGTHRLEHRWACRLIASRPHAAVVDGFGSSDCSCKSHLVHFELAPELRDLDRILGAQWHWSWVDGDLSRSAGNDG